MRNLLLITLLAATPGMNAQRMASASPHFARSYHHGGHSRSFLAPLAYYDPFYSDYLSSTGYPVASQPPVIIVQTPAAAAPVAERASSPAQPLMIELQGDRYVRLSGGETSDSQMIDSIATMPHRQERSAPAEIQPVAPTESAPAVLGVSRWTSRRSIQLHNHQRRSLHRWRSLHRRLLEQKDRTLFYKSARDR